MIEEKTKRNTHRSKERKKEDEINTHTKKTLNKDEDHITNRLHNYVLSANKFRYSRFLILTIQITYDK